MYFQEGYVQDQNAPPMQDWRNSPDLSGGYPQAKRFGERDYAAMEAILGYTQEQELEDAKKRAFQAALRKQQLQDLATGGDGFMSDPTLGNRYKRENEAVQEALSPEQQKLKKRMWKQIAGMGAEGLSGLLVPPASMSKEIDYSLFPAEQQINPWAHLAGGGGM